MNDVKNFRDRLVTMNQKNKRVDSFYVTFLGIPENLANTLGGQVKSITRPEIDIITGEQRQRGSTFKNQFNVTLSPVSVVFYDDEDSVTSSFLYMQLFRQLNKHPDKFGQLGLDRDYRFDIKVEVYNARNQVVEGFVLRDCFIKGIAHSDPVISADNECDISVSLEYDNVDILIFDEYLNFRG